MIAETSNLSPAAPIETPNSSTPVETLLSKETQKEIKPLEKEDFKTMEMWIKKNFFDARINHFINKTEMAKAHRGERNALPSITQAVEHLGKQLESYKASLQQNSAEKTEEILKIHAYLEKLKKVEDNIKFLKNNPLEYQPALPSDQQMKLLAFSKDVNNYTKKSRVDA